MRGTGLFDMASTLLTGSALLLTTARPAEAMQLGLAWATDGEYAGEICADECLTTA